MTNPLTPDLRTALAARLSDGALRDTVSAYLSEPRGAWTGVAGAVAAPRDTEEVARIVRFANEHRIAIVPWGGGTGLVGGQVMEIDDPIVLSLERMTAVRDVRPDENVLVTDAGTILTEIHRAASDADRLFPLSLASEGTARIGGLLSTNAGGVNVLRYGNARDLCLGIEAVLPDGQIMHGLKRLRKDNTGYDLRNLLIGAEGTLGIITAATLRLFPIPARTGTAMMVVRDPDAALRLLNRAQVIGGVSAFELISGQGLRFLHAADLGPRQPFDPIPDWCVLIDVGLSDRDDPAAILEDLFSKALTAGLVNDGVIAQSEAQRRDLWAIRETIPEANRHIGAIASNDISLPLSNIAGFIADCSAQLRQVADVRLNCFGHLGDGNLHFNIFPAEDRVKRDYDADALRRIVDDAVDARGGSFSAEHGVGRLKVDQLEHYGDPAKLSAMRAIKAALDPSGIMNPGAILRV